MKSLSTFRSAPVLAAVAMVCLAGSACALDPGRAMSQYVRHRWGPENGFPAGPVSAITQTTDGYLWIGTDAGLVRFDGSTFNLVRDSGPAGYSIDRILGLTADRDGNLWVRIPEPTLLRYRDGAFTYSSPDPHYEARVTATTRTHDGELLLASRRNGAEVLRASKFETLATAAALPRSPVTSIAETATDDVWLGTRDEGLIHLHGQQVSTIRKGLADLAINCLLPAGNGGLWIGTNRGMFRLSDLEITQSGVPSTLIHEGVLAMTRDRDSNIWIGTAELGLLRLNAKGLASFAEPDRVPGGAATAVFEDREGNLWTGTANGIERLSEGAFVTWAAPQELPPENDGPIYADSRGRIWWGPDTGGLYWLSDGKIGRVTEAGLGEDVVYSIAGSEGELWLGRQHGGLTHLQPEGGSFQAETYTQREGLAQNSISAVHRARDGTVWAGTLNAGVSRIRGREFKTFTSQNGLAADTVTSIFEGSDGTMWFGTAGGLSRFAGDRWQSYGLQDGLPSENVNCLIEDSAGVLWVGTLSGIAVVRSGHISRPLRLPPALREEIFGLAEDRTGSLWVATSNHILRVVRAKLLDGTLADGDLREYGLTDGLPGVRGVKRHRPVAVDPVGRVWMSMPRGISVIDPARVTGNSVPTIVHVRGVSADNSPLNLGGKPHIPAGSRTIVIGYAGLNLSAPDRIRYKTKLDGSDHGWNSPVAANEAVYTNLGPGSYRFHVLASDPDGVWNGAEATLAFEFDPAFWQTWWFRLGAALASAFAIVALYRSRLRRLTEQLSSRFEERLAERTRIAQELHDTLLQGVLSASLQLHLVADRLPPDSKVGDRVNRILQLMAQVVSEGRNAVKGLRLAPTESLDIEQEFSRIQGELGIGDGEEVAFRVIVEGSRRPLHPILRDEALRIGREAVINAFRHAHATSIEVELEYAARQFRVLVRDNGLGIDPEVLRSGREGHWGLPGMRERADQIGARLRVRSRDKMGAEVELSIPGHIAFRVVAPNQPRRWFANRHARRDK